VPYPWHSGAEFSPRDKNVVNPLNHVEHKRFADRFRNFRLSHKRLALNGRGTSAQAVEPRLAYGHHAPATCKHLNFRELCGQGFG